MRYSLILIAIAIFVTLGPTPILNAQEDTTTLTTSQKIYGLSLFWKEVSYNFAFFYQVPDLDWDSAYQAYIPRVIAAKTTYDYYRELQRFCALLKDGHTSINMPGYLWDSITYPKLLLAEYNHRMYIRNVDSGLVDQIPIGTEILTIDGHDAIDFVQKEVMPYLSISAEHVLWDMGIRTALLGKRGSRVELALKRPDGTDTTVSLVREREGVRWYRAFPDRPLLHLDWLDGDIAHLELNSFNDTAIVSQFEAVLPQLYKSRGIIIDLRHNGGGNTDNGTDILEHFSTDTLWGSKWQSPEHIAAFKAWGKWYHDQGIESDKVPYYTGDAWYEGDTWFVVPDSGRKIEAPVVVLFGRNTGSAAEDFLIFADKLEQFTYVGEPTNGSTGQPLFINNLPGGGSARICTKRDTYPDGRDFVGVGVQPDVFVQGTVQSLIDGSDPMLAKAVAVLATKIDH